MDMGNRRKKRIKSQGRMVLSGVGYSRCLSFGKINLNFLKYSGKFIVDERIRILFCAHEFLFMIEYFTQYFLVEFFM